MNQDSRIEAALEFPWHLRAYERWLGQRSTDMDDYLYSQQRVRFSPEDEDQLAIPDGLSVEQAENTITVRIPGQTHAFPVSALTRQHAVALVTALQSRPTVIELPYASGVSSEICDRMLEAGFGRFIFAPDALAQLESSCSCAEIVRFPGSPYEIVRNYWLNVGSLSHTIDRTLAESRSNTSFVHWLRGLHVQLLLGADLKTFYCPASPVALRRVEPGALFTVVSRTLKTVHGEFIIDGPRVNASTVGGSQYHRLVDQSLGIRSSACESRSFLVSGTNWGRLVNARARAETMDRQWYLPPRPLADEHWDAIFTARNAAVAAPCVTEAAAHLGRLHWCFVHLHPFSCANQSLVFALINFGLKRFTSGIPHLILDQLALRHDCAEYVRLFARAVGNWTTKEVEPAARHLERVGKRQVLDQFIAQLSATKSEAEADAIANRDERAGRLALLFENHG